MKKQIKKNIYLLLCIFCVFFLCTTSYAADTLKQFGQECQHNSECLTGDCESANNGKSYCDCSDSNVPYFFPASSQCKEIMKDMPKIKSKPEIEINNVDNYYCVDGAYTTEDLDYCLFKINKEEYIIKAPPYSQVKDLSGLAGSIVDGIFDPEALARAAQKELNEAKQLIQKPVTQIIVPGLQFSEIDIEVEGGRKYFTIPFFADYVSALYKWATIAITILSVIIIIFSGFLWTTSAGNQGAITKAKKLLSNAIIGLFLGLGSYTILYTINPDLVKLKHLRVASIKTIELGKYNEDVVNEHGAVFERKHDAGETKGDGKSTPIPTASGITYGYNNVPWFFQFAQPWASIQYGSDAPPCEYKEPITRGRSRKVAFPPGCCATIGKAGCGPAAFAMVINALGSTGINPSHIAKIANQTGARVCGKGTTVRTQGNKKHKFLTKLEEKYNVNITILTTYDEAITKLRENKFMIVSGKSAGYGSTGKKKTYKGHYLVLTGAETKEIKGVKTEIIHVNDSGNRPHKGITYMTTDQLQAREPLFYLIEKK